MFFPQEIVDESLEEEEEDNEEDEQARQLAKRAGGDMPTSEEELPEAMQNLLDNDQLPLPPQGITIVLLSSISCNVQQKLVPG